MITDITKIHKEFLEDREKSQEIRELFPNTKKGFYMWCAEDSELAYLAYNAGYLTYVDMYLISEEFANNNPSPF